jgi:hydroxyacylglutathione hydrolase
MIEIEQFSCLSDNYGNLMHDPQSGATATIDTPEVEPILNCLARRGWTLTHILNTHHHFDHAGGNLELKERTGCTIIGPEDDAAHIQGLDQTVNHGDQIAIGAIKLDILNVGGHTKGHIAYHCPDARVAFVGDTLFVLGCGRIFEGTPAQMWQSLTRLAALPAETVVYCAHEYTLANAKFALTIDPHNQRLQTRIDEFEALRRDGKPTVPTTIALERETNPFLRAADPDIRSRLAMSDAEDVEVFAEIRRRKDSF